MQKKKKLKATWGMALPYAGMLSSIHPLEGAWKVFKMVHKDEVKYRSMKGRSLICDITEKEKKIHWAENKNF